MNKEDEAKIEDTLPEKVELVIENKKYVYVRKDVDDMLTPFAVDINPDEVPTTVEREGGNDLEDDVWQTV